MIAMIISVIILVGLYLSINGMILGNYLLIGILVCHIMIIFSTSSLAIGFFRAAAEQEPKSRPPAQGYSYPTNLLLQLALAVAGYHLFLLGHNLLAGALLVTIPIAFAANVLHFFVYTLNK